MALTSKNFCSAAWATFWLIVRNAARFSIVSGIGFILMFVGKALIVALSGAIAYIIIMQSYLKNDVYSPIFPVIACVGISYLIAAIFLSVFSFSSTAILHCYILDEEIGSNKRPKSIEAFDKKNKELNEKR